jgi:hypothetical protein
VRRQTGYPNVLLTRVFDVNLRNAVAVTPSSFIGE